LAWVKLEEYEENIVYKTLNFSNDTLFLDKQTIYTIAGKLVNPEKTGQKKLYYYNAVKVLSHSPHEKNFPLISQANEKF